MNGWEIAGVVLCVLILPSIYGLLSARNSEFERFFGKLYLRAKISNTAFYMWSRDQRKRTNWLELGHIENTSGTHRVYTITIFLLTAQIGWNGKPRVKTETKTESSFTYNGKMYTGPNMPDDIKTAMAEMDRMHNELFMNADELLNRFRKGKQ
jgi:predicted RND superfamily exporter protein